MSNKLQDQFNMGRIPIRPLNYENKDKAFTQELMVDCLRSNEGETPSYHLYLTDPTDARKVIDLSAIILEGAYNGKGLMIHIDGMANPMSLDEAISYIYKRFVHVSNPTGYVASTDLPDVLNRNNVNVVLKDVNNQAVYPITRTDAVIDDKGNTLQDRLNNITRIGFSNAYLQVSSTGQNIFEITYPFPNYLTGGNYMQLMVGTTMLDASRYNITEWAPDSTGKVNGCTVSFYNDTFEEGRRIDILFIYNSMAIDGNQFTPIDGHTIALRTIPVNRIDRVSSSYVLNDPNTLATSKSVRDAYEQLCSLMNHEGNKVCNARDLTPESNTVITVNMANDGIVLASNYIMLNVVVTSPKQSHITLKLTSIDNTINKNSIITSIPVDLPSPITGNMTVRFMINEHEAIPAMKDRVKLNMTRYIHYSVGDEMTISYNDMDVIEDGLLKIYRNGVRLFEDVDYTINSSAKQIKLFVKTNKNERIIFECEYLTY